MTRGACLSSERVSASSIVSTVDSEIYYGLITLIELADKDYHQGCPSLFICEKYNIQPARLMKIVEKLEQIKLINIVNDCLYLKEEPHGLWIIKAMSLLKLHFIK